MREKDLQRYLSRTTAMKVRLRLTDTLAPLVRTHPEGSDEVGVTLHGMFLDAPAGVLRALAGWIRKPGSERERRVARLYRDAGLARDGVRPGGARPVTLRHAGRYFDLKVVFDRLNERQFDGEVRAFITWGRRSARPARRSIHFGSYNWERRLIRINPALDRSYVPRYFVESVVHHEMLHAALGVRLDDHGRLTSHSPEFRLREATFPRHERARAWERRNLHRFLCRGPRN